MGCGQSSQNVVYSIPPIVQSGQKGGNLIDFVQKQAKIQQIRQNQQNKHRNKKPTRTPSEGEQTWQQFSQQQTAINILCKEEMSSNDFEFLSKNQIWKEQWFILACQLLRINSDKNKQHEAQIMSMFFQVKIKEARFLQSEPNMAILCEKCYKIQLQKFRIDQGKLNNNLLLKCKTCSGFGWVKKEQCEDQMDKSDCAMCKKNINLYGSQTQCLACNTLGFVWKNIN